MASKVRMTKRHLQEMVKAGLVDSTCTGRTTYYRLIPKEGSGDEVVDLLESLLSITEPFTDEMNGEARKEWQRISARCADIREARDVAKEDDMIIWVRLEVRPREGAPVTNPEGAEIGEVLSVREGPEGIWEAQLRIDNEEIARRLERQFPQYKITEVPRDRRRPR